MAPWDVAIGSDRDFYSRGIQPREISGLNAKELLNGWPVRRRFLKLLQLVSRNAVGLVLFRGGGVFREKADTTRRAGQDFTHVRVIAIRDNQAPAWDDSHKLAKGALHRGEVLKNISVIEFDVVEDNGVGKIVNELAAFVEERRVVLVAFGDEEWPVIGVRCLVIVVRSGARAAAEIIRNAANQEPRR